MTHDHHEHQQHDQQAYYFCFTHCHGKFMAEPQYLFNRLVPNRVRHLFLPHASGNTASQARKLSGLRQSLEPAEVLLSTGPSAELTDKTCRF